MMVHQELFPPLVVIDGDDSQVFDSVTDLESYLEGVDVEDGAYRVFDSRGNRVRLEASGVRRGAFWVIPGTARVIGCDPDPTGEATVSAILAGRLRAMGLMGKESLSAAELVSRYQSRRGTGG